jgi:hypothetical protein
MDKKKRKAIRNKISQIEISLFKEEIKKFNKDVIEWLRSKNDDEESLANSDLEKLLNIDCD